MSGQAKRSAIGLGIVLAVIGLYNALMFDRYLPLSEGWFSVYARCILDGAIPYRDFHFFLPPVYPYMIAGFTGVFGSGLIGLRILGVGITLSIAAMLFLLYSRLFSARVACIAAIVTVVYYQSDVTFIGYNFLNVLHLLALCGTLLICKYFDHDNRSPESAAGRRAAAMLLGAGSLFALAFLIKQSDGLFVLLASFAAVAASAYARDGFRRGLGTLAVYSAGVLLPMLVLLIWLISTGTMASFLDQVFRGASSSKGGLAAILFNWIPRLFTRANIGGLAATIAALAALRLYSMPGGFMLGRAGNGKGSAMSPATPGTVVRFTAILALFSAGILVPFWSSGISQGLCDNSVFNFTYERVLLISGFTGCLLLLCVFLVRMVRREEGSHRDSFIVSAVSLGILWGTSTSAALGNMGMLMGLGLLVGVLLSIPSLFRRTRIAIVLLCASLVLFLSSRKYIEPYNWWGLDQSDIRETSMSVQAPYLGGFVLSPQASRIYLDVTAIVRENTGPQDRIYTFPNIPIFYLLTERHPDTFGIVSWFDVEPDRFALADARSLQESPPEAIIYLDVPEFVWEGHEEGFRGGNMSGQRTIQKVIEELTSSDLYELEATYEVPDGYTLTVWIMV